VTKETAFYAPLKAMTDQWMDLFDYWAPTVVTDTLEEYNGVRQTAGLMDFGMLRKYDITGPGALELVNSVVTRDLTKLRPHQIAYTALCNPDGKMADDCTVMVFGPEHIRFCGANDADLGFFQERADDGISFRVFTDETGHLCLQGPKSREMLQGMTSDDLSNEAFPYYTFRDDVTIAGIPVFMNRLGYTAELGYELWVDAGRALELWDALVEHTTPGGAKIVGMDALDLFRIEGGFIIGGVEYDSSVSPYECGLGWTVALDKGDFQGKAGLKHDREATTLRLATVELEGGGADATGAPLSVDGSEVGLVTQAVDSPYVGKTLGLAKIRQDLREPGTKVTANVGGQDVAGAVVRHPVYDPDRIKVKG
jgi:aminomethyltransferase